MQRSTLNILLCPQCGGSLALRSPAIDDVIDSGELLCDRCLKAYMIEDGMLHLVSKYEVMDAYPQMEEQGRKGARFYDWLMSKYAEEILGISLDDVRSDYLKRLELFPGAKLLDVGAGTGTDLVSLWHKTTNVQLFGIDISIEMLGQCRHKLSKHKALAELFLGLAERLPFKDGTFDVVFHVGSINEFNDQRLAIAEMIRIAKPGTKIVIVDEWLTTENMRQPMGRRLAEALPSLPREVVPPTDCVPAEMVEKRVEVIWRGYGYCLQFRKPV